MNAQLCIYGTLNSSDALYIPAFYWHQVTALDTGISVNMFYGNSGENDYDYVALDENKEDGIKPTPRVIQEPSPTLPEIERLKIYI